VFFDQPDAERVLFGGKAVLAARSTFFKETAPVDPALGVADSAGPLTAEQEVLLFQRYNYARVRAARLILKYQGSRMPYGTVRRVLAWGHRALLARGQLIQANIGLVLAMAKKPRDHGRDFDELVSEGNVSLLRSVDKFDCSRGYKFSTYACRAILRSFTRMRQKARQYQNRFPVEFDTSLEKSDALDRKRTGQRDASIETIRGIVGESQTPLDDVERFVIRERFSLDGGGAPGKTLVQLGELLGVTKERVRQIQNSALRKLRSQLERELRAA
jgi:RNA polymerase sigma factor (sigma-70 family)